MILNGVVGILQGVAREHQHYGLFSAATFPFLTSFFSPASVTAEAGSQPIPFRADLRLGQRYLCL